MRGKTKDAEAEALLRLLRQEQDFHRQVSIPRIQRKEPLPSIRGKSTAIEETSDECSNVFISQMKTELSDKDVCYSETQFLSGNSKDLFYNNSDYNGGNLSPRRKKSYEWKKEPENSLYRKYERQRKSIKTLPPLEPRASSPREFDSRPSRPPPSSPRLKGED